MKPPARGGSSPWRWNSRCRGCGYRRHGEYSPFDTTCPGCGLSARWAWQVWSQVLERRAGPFWRRRWEEHPRDEAFTTDEKPGVFVW